MKIDAVICSVNYGDFLNWCLQSCRNTFDRLVVVTSKADEETKKICKYWFVECIETDIFYKDGAKFNKGLGIQLGLDFLGSDDWSVTMDADIVLPPRFNEFIRARKFKKDCIYGIDRVDVKDWDTWMNFITNPYPQQYIGSTWFPQSLPLMYRVVQGYSYSPVGFYQMWHSQCKYAEGGYPINSNSAADSDLRFAMKFPSENRLLIPELYVYHLSSESCSIGANWEKRTTKKFGPKESNQ